MSAAAGEAILALNAGSSSIKAAIFARGENPRLLLRGGIEEMEASPALRLLDAEGNEIETRRWDEANPGHEALLTDLLERIERHLDGTRLIAVGHRIVHGGADFVEPVRIDGATLAALEKLTPLAPLHQPLCLAPVAAMQKLRPGLLQVACFDTAFHHGLEPPVSRYALPLGYEQDGIRKYGFHGLSYEHIARHLAALSPHLSVRKTVVAHLGSGASLCALQHGQSRDTTMGFSALDGLVMGTRPGAIDPGVLLYLLRQRGMTPEALEALLYHKAGLLGVSGLSSDMRQLLASPAPRAAEAVELFVFRLAREVAAMAATLGGLEMLVFTGGVGEHSAPVRTMLAKKLAWLGVKLEPAANEAGAERIDVPQSAVEVRVVAANEELSIARHVARLLED